MSVLDTLRRACGPDRVRVATDVDAIDGVRPTYVAAPHNLSAIAELMVVAYQKDLVVIPRGGGSKLDWGHPPTKADLIVDVSSQDAILEHAAGDLIVRVQAGVRLSTLQEALASAGQRLAVDEVVPGSTIGGVVATALSGPSRLLYGAVRDLLIGVTVVRADGVVARSGGRVVKNVAGYDLCKLYTGSYGTLGLVVEAIFRLHPIPEASAYISVAVPDESAVGLRVAAILASQVVPTAVEIDRPRTGSTITVCALVDGSDRGVAARAQRLVSLLGPGAITSPEQPTWWAQLPLEPAIIRITAEPAGVAGVLRVLDAAGANLALSVRGSAGTGVLYAGVDSEPADVAVVLGLVRDAAARAGGSALLLRAPSAVKAIVDVWGPIPAIALMRRVKSTFDPGARLSPGRFVGGI